MNLLNITDMDWQLVKCIGYLHSGDSINKEDAMALQMFLEESIKNKYGIVKDLTNLVTSSIKPESVDRIEEYKPVLNIYEDSKVSNSDDELELDLFKDDLMCVVCNGMDVAARNQLLECSDCHALYHQDCHRPVVSLQDSFDSWDLNKKSKPLSSVANSTFLSAPQSLPAVPSSSLKLTISRGSGHKNSTTSDNHKSSDSKNNSTSISKSTSSAMKVQSNSSSSRNVTPNINIISADKRIQNMKKKAAKLQEKRKLPKMC
ncbi:hypothetical protein WA026_004647 [Henosepilachna vigintioctopunctata]|uniref:PHD-type domain-containing protein n=1 Tax=Henosepilachna vigintioctopunctata TaxID=420089 RepID=A0AAW1V8K2_9CUCU